MTTNRFTNFAAALASVSSLDELNQMALEIFNEISKECDLSDYDLMWLGVDCLDERAMEMWSQDYNSVIAIAKAVTAFSEIKANIFPKEMFTEDANYFLLGEFANPSQHKAVIKYCLANNLADKLFASVDIEVDMGAELGIVVIPALTMEDIIKVADVKEVENLTIETIDFLEFKIVTLDNDLNSKVILDAVAKCENCTELAQFVTNFGKFTHVEGLTYQLHPAISILTYGHVEVNFEELSITTSREFNLRNKGFVINYGEITGSQLLALVLITITGSNDQFWGQNYLDAYLNNITATEEEQDVYGDQMNESQQLRIIRTNTVAILRTETYFLKFPYIQLRNNNNAKGVDQAAKYYLAKKIPFFVDKVAMKRIVLDAGVSALYAAMDFDKGILKTILDVAKPGKLFTRGWQTLCTPASQGILGLQKEAVKYIDSNLVIQHYHKNGEVEEITIKGEPAITITGDANFAINGSGVGYTWKPWAASCKKTLRDSFNAMSLKEGETLDQVTSELTDALNVVLSDKSVRKSGTHLLNFRGRPMLSYRGLNQEFVTHSEYGSEFKIRQLGTSKTLQVTFTVVYIYTDLEPKVRGLGEKTVLKSADKTGSYIYDEAGNQVTVKALLNAECLKGNASRLQQYAEFCRVILETKGGTLEDYKVALIGGHHKLAMEAIEAPELIKSGDEWVWTGNRTIQSLDDLNTPFYQWWAENTKTYYLTDLMAVHDFLWLLLGRAKLQQEWDGSNNICQELLSKALLHPANSKVKLVNVTSGERTTKLSEAMKFTNFVQVEEEFSGVRSLYVFQMELASIRECSNAGQSSTIQQIASVYAANATLGEALADGIYAKEVRKGKVTKIGYKTIEQEDAVLGLVAMSQNDIATKVIGKEFKPASTLTTWTLKDLAIWNNSVFNSGANEIYPTNADPYLAFFDASATNKFKFSGLVNRVGITDPTLGIDGQGKSISYTFVQAMEGSAANYTMNVGTGYNVASAASCMAALSRYKFDRAKVNKASNAELLSLAEDIKLWGWVNALAWKTAYENAWLASYNDKGEKLAGMLHEYRKGFVTEGEKITVTPQQVIDRLKELICKIEGIPTTQISDKWVSKFLWAYRIARAVSSVERKENGLTKAMYDLTLKEEDVVYLSICGAFRRCDQGRFSNNEELLLTDSEEGQGTSMWTLLNEEWELAKTLLPRWLARKLWKAMQVHLNISETAKAISNKEGGTNYQISGLTNDRVTFDSDNQQVTLASLDDDLSLAKVGVPTIYFEYANQDLSEGAALRIPQRKGGKLVLEECTDIVALQGAFIHYSLYCPLKRIKTKDTDGKAQYQFMADSDVAGKLEVNYGGSVCYVWKRSLTSKEVLQQAAIRYPQGALITTEDEVQGVTPNLYVDFDAVLKTGAFTASGAATGFALNLTNFLVSMSKKAVEKGRVRDEAKFRKYGRNQIAGLQGQLREMEREGLIKKLGKSAPTKQGSKVQSTHSAPYIYSEHGIIPVFMLNPEDEVVQAGNYRTGDFVSISRTPMVAKAYGVLVLSTSVAIGHLDISGKVFALSNRGDGDGDPVDLLKERGSLSKEELISFLGEDVVGALQIQFAEE